MVAVNRVRCTSVVQSCALERYNRPRGPATAGTCRRGVRCSAHTSFGGGRRRPLMCHLCRREPRLFRLERHWRRSDFRGIEAHGGFDEESVIKDFVQTLAPGSILLPSGGLWGKCVLQKLIPGLEISSSGEATNQRFDSAWGPWGSWGSRR